VNASGPTPKFTVSVSPSLKTSLTTAFASHSAPCWVRTPLGTNDVAMPPVLRREGLGGEVSGEREGGEDGRTDRWRNLLAGE
jgi:hypothetical protein